jgi:hypothetical protein
VEDAMPSEYPTSIIQQPLTNHPDDKTYPFPDIPGLDKPARPASKTIAQHIPIGTQKPTLGGSSAPVISSSPFFGVTRVSVVVNNANRAFVSQAFNNGKGDTDKKGKYLDEVNRANLFNFAPGVDKPLICWKVRNTSQFKKVTFELFANGQTQPIWSKTWEKDIETNLKKDPIQAGTKVKGKDSQAIAWDGSLNWEEHVRINHADFPDGILTVRHSPYQLKMTVNDGQVGPEQLGYPLIAWTYIHVLVDSVELIWGDESLLSPNRTDVDPIYQTDILKYEKNILQALKQKHTKLAENLSHEVYLTSNQYAHTATVDEKTTNTDYSEYQKMWGDGPRIPLLAKVYIQTTNGTKTDKAPKALVGTKVLWDWQDKDRDRWRQPVANTTIITKDFLQEQYQRYNPTAKPAGSSNCPKALGGKLGDPNAPVFPPQNGQGEFSYEVVPCKTRTWAALSKVKADGMTGVIFQPARMAGDRYEVSACFYFSDALDSEQDIDVTNVQIHVGAGKFDIFRQINLTYLVRGSDTDLACNTDDCKQAIATIFRQELGVVVDINKVPVNNGIYQQAIANAMEQLIRDPVQYSQYPAFPLVLRYLLNLDPPDNSPGVCYVDRPKYLENLEAAFKAARIRHIEITNFTQFKIGEEFEGVTSGARGVSLKLWSKGLSLVLLNPNSPEFQDGEQVRGRASGAIDTATVSPSRSCWGHTYRLFRNESDTYKEAIQVAFNDQNVVTVSYSKKTFTLELKTSLSAQAKQDLKNMFEQVSRALPDENAAMTIEFRGRQNSDNAKRRMEVLKDYFEQLWQEFVLIDRKAIFQELCTKGDNGWNFLYDLDIFQSQMGGNTFKLHDRVLPAIVEQYVQLQYPQTQGVFLLHMPCTNNLIELKEGRGKYIALPVEGAYFSDALINQRQQGILYFATLDPKGAFVRKAASKSLRSVISHEIAHALFKAHAPSAIVGSYAGENDPAQAAPTTHVARDNCLMNYDVDSEHFCGLCILRTRGWNWNPSGANTVAEMEYQISLELGDIDAMFLNAATSDAGKKERLQVLGLFNRPLKHKESDDCLTFAWSHAQSLFPALQASNSNVAGDLAQLIGDFVVEGGALPAPGQFAKIRIPTYPVLYSSAFLEAKFEENEQNTEESRPFEKYMTEVAKRYFVGQSYFEDNPLLGKIPLVVKVKKRPKGSKLNWNTAPLAPEAKVYFQLIAPDPLPTYAQPIKKASTAKHAVAGGFSHYNRVAAPALATQPQQYFASKVDTYLPGASDNPLTGNVHTDLGGKRKDNTLPDIFYTTKDQGLEPLPAVQAGNKHRYAVAVSTNAQGEAHVLFAPSSIGGDRYKIRAYVGPFTLDNDGTQPGDAVIETGTMVRWRSIRLCRQVCMPASKTLTDLPDYLKQADDTPISPELKKYVGDLPTLDFAGRMTQEFAKGYCELILEPAALTRESVNVHSQTILQQMAALSRDYPAFNKPRRTDDGSSGGVSIFKEDLKVDPTDTTGTRFITQLSTLPEPNTITVRVKDLGKDSAILSDEISNTNLTGNLYNTKKETLSTFAIDYTTGEVMVVFPSPPTKQYQIAYYPDSYVDAGQLVLLPTVSPFLFNLRLPTGYNQRKAAKYLPFALNAKGEPFDSSNTPTHGFQFVLAKKLGFVKGFLMEAMVRGIGNNNGFYPGVVMIQALALDNYSVIWKDSGTQEGKGVGLGVFVFGNGSNDLDKLHTLAIHEMSHSLYFKHAPTAVGFKKELHDKDDICVMSYDANDGDYCGQCVASLRGMNEQSPLLRTADP